MTEQFKKEDEGILWRWSNMATYHHGNVKTKVKIKGSNYAIKLKGTINEQKRIDNRNQKAS